MNEVTARSGNAIDKIVFLRIAAILMCAVTCYCFLHYGIKPVSFDGLIFLAITLIFIIGSLWKRAGQSPIFGPTIIWTTILFLFLRSCYMHKPNGGYGVLLAVATILILLMLFRKAIVRKIYRYSASK